MYGLIQKDFEYINEALSQFEDIEKAAIFGSRAQGNYKKGSDVDLVVYGDRISSKTIYKLDDLLNEEFPLPYFFDVVHFEQIQNENLQSHIKEVGKIIYSKKER
ncbi:nucleotidyltransferase domain-containing protein [Bacillus mangrovi]|uniref:Nucleotidyltransferase domain-containing protein n=1 Tax=Metabacillus mangrovi TaxID=1491830 RepID=A0A7X2S7K4_9BACI|nr:nucleotidyltransferase domain-containing protein [Metabacillus mangrovi]MTH54950.1 nucleotidyltransferase domain-containing protein [Metabacillus mangrovi]